MKDGLFFFAMIAAMGSVLVGVGLGMRDQEEQRRKLDERRKHECIDVGGVVVPSSEGWTCHVPGAVKVER